MVDTQEHLATDCTVTEFPHAFGRLTLSRREVRGTQCPNQMPSPSHGKCESRNSTTLWSVVTHPWTFGKK